MNPNWELIDQMIEEGYITARPHDTLPLLIYNYTPTAQYDQVWNEATIMCRGLVADHQRNIVTRPFEKFFNLEQHDELPQEPFRVFEKYDGSLLIVARHGDDIVVSTRGSFGSPQAAIGEKLVHGYGLDFIQPGWTYLFEVIYPGNRIVVDYEDMKDIVFLAAINNETGEELLPPFDGVPTPQAESYEINSIEDLYKVESKNREGFVIRYDSGLRVKVKFEEYKRLHRLMTGLSAKEVWSQLAEGNSLEQCLTNVPDEFHKWLEKTISQLKEGYQAIRSEAEVEFQTLTEDLADPLRADRKTAAQRFSQTKNPHVLFALLTGKNLDKVIWKMLKPVGNVVFRDDSDTGNAGHDSDRK